MELPEEAASAFGFYQNRLKLQGIKFALDGSPQGKTAFWTEPLLTKGPGGEENWRGQPLFPPEVVNKALAEVYGKGIQVFCHANGDAAIDMIIDGARAAGVKACRRPPHGDHPFAGHAPRTARRLCRTRLLAQLLHRAHLLLGLRAHGQPGREACELHQPDAVGR